LNYADSGFIVSLYRPSESLSREAVKLVQDIAADPEAAGMGGVAGF
jgi:hypothetical protein